MRTFDNPEKTYQEQESRRRGYIETSVKTTVARLSTYLEDLDSAFRMCGRNGQRGNGKAHLIAHSEWAGYYITGDFALFQREGGNFFQRHGLRDEHDVPANKAGAGASEKSNPPSEARKNARTNLKDGLQWKSQIGNPADDLFYFRGPLIEIIDATYLQSNEDHQLLYPSPGQIAAGSRELQEKLLSIAPDAVVARLAQLDRLKDETLGKPWELPILSDPRPSSL